MPNPQPPRTADLHLHTRFSDGTETPERVVELARAAGLSCISITDHDTLDSQPRAQAAAQQHGLELIPGVEMSANAGGTEVHLLGYWVDPAHPPFRAHLDRQKTRRIGRVHEMCAQLASVGVTIDPADVLALAAEGTVGRPHVARILVKRGYVATMPEAFDKYIGDGKPGFVPGSPVDPAAIIRLIRDAGGVPVLAHPMYLRNDALIEQFARDGLAGIEALHSSHPPELVLRYERLAAQLKLLVTGGSDFHGQAKEGLPVGAVKVPYALVDALKSWRAAAVR
jgi:hypothetical protein